MQCLNTTLTKAQKNQSISNQQLEAKILQRFLLANSHLGHAHLLYRVLLERVAISRKYFPANIRDFTANSISNTAEMYDKVLH